MIHGARPLRSTRRLQNYASAMPKWYNVVRNSAGPTQVSIYDEIGFYGVPAAMFLDELRQAPGDIELHLHSPGGDIYEGLAIYSGLLQAQKRGIVSVIIDGLAASAASFIAMAASPGKLEISPHSRMMVHDGFCMAIGNASDLRELAGQLEEESDNIAGIYADRTGKPAAYWRDKMRATTWYSDQQAVAEGLADRIHGQESPQDGWDLSVFDRYSPVVVNADGGHAPMTGTHSHAHPAFGSQGGDASHEHEHSHDGDADHGHSHDPDGDGDDDTTASGDTDHDYVKPDGSPGPKARLRNAEKYSADDRKAMAEKGHAMPDGSYPVADAEDLDNAIHAVGRGGADHDAIRAHIIKRAEALGLSSKIPDNWNADGSLKSPGNLSDTEILAMFAGELQLSAGKE